MPYSKKIQSHPTCQIPGKRPELAKFVLIHVVAVNPGVYRIARLGLSPDDFPFAISLVGV